MTCIVIGVGARHVKHEGTAEGDKTVGGSSSGSQLSPGWGLSRDDQQRPPERQSQGCGQGRRQALAGRRRAEAAAVQDAHILPMLLREPERLDHLRELRDVGLRERACVGPRANSTFVDRGIPGPPASTAAASSCPGVFQSSS
jgi:hypothetical protein